MSTDGTLLGIEGRGGKAVFALHAVAGLVMIALGLAAIPSGVFAQTLLYVLIGVMILIVGRSAGRIVARR